MKRVALIVVALGLIVGTARQAKANSSLGVDFLSTPTDFGESVWNLGFEFQANIAATVTALGNVDLTGTGYGQPQQIGLWDASGNLLASTFVDNSDPLTSTYWRFNAITPVTLVAGAFYVVGGQGGADYAGETPVTVNPYITYISDLYTYNGSTANTPLVEPTLSEGLTSPTSAGWFGGNIEFGAAAVPEPSSVLLLGMGAISMGAFSGWRRRKVVAN